MAEYKFRDLEALTGATRSDLIYWLDRRGVVRPDVRKAGGAGKHRLFSFFNVFETAIATHLSRYGLEAERIKRILQGLRYQAARIRPTGDVPQPEGPSAQWAAFTRPHTRPRVAWLIVRWPFNDFVFYDAEALAAHLANAGDARFQAPSLIAVDLKAILEDLERKTGDQLE